ncbi:hypothetical protein Glove_121g71 [Diversispora epigaea]|uniref:Molybdenum cofactor sulfurase n=1 Tax=Diversispora epigaea TaxID=1348612 RepID=A0A397J8M3_9GLOM|nr:hypothetical protein Glove_121g71 [Diversispora epigaea]
MTKNFELEKTEFLREFSNQYGYNGKIDKIRENEYPQLKGITYLDHSGSTTYPKSVFTSFTKDLTNNLYGNPHSRNPSAQNTSQRVDQVRAKILKHFNAKPDEYQVIFTQNATAAIKLVGEIFPWNIGKSSYRYLRESHNSLIGLRNFAKESNSPDIQVVTEDDLNTLFTYENNVGNDDDNNDNNDDDVIYNLFAYPAQCNFSGERFPLSWISQIKKFNTEKSKFLVLLDSAAYSSTSLLSLIDKDNSPDFVVLSFYKIFGFPTGLGALIIKSELNSILKKRYFGGGTLDAIAYDKIWQEFKKDLSLRYEDGTINFLDIIALGHSFNAMEEIYTDFKFITNHVTSLIRFLYIKMKSYQHWNGKSVCIIHSNNDFSNNKIQGPVFNFIARRADGSLVGYAELEKLASVNGIHIGAGPLCNPGCMDKWVNLSGDEIVKNFKAGKLCGDDNDIFNGKPTGTIRISLGAMTTIEDILIWLDFFKTYFVETINVANNVEATNNIRTTEIINNNSDITLERLILYPIKSCHGFTIPSSISWPITNKGLLYDREWMLISIETGRALSQKLYPKMTLIHPKVIREKELLIITAPGKEPLQIHLNEYPNEFESLTCSSQVCGDNVEAFVYISEHVTQWFTEFLGVNCRLARQSSTKSSLNNHNNNNNNNGNNRFIKPDLLNSESNLPLSLSNESPFLLISQKSVDHVNQKILEYNSGDTNNNENGRYNINDINNVNNGNNNNCKTEEMKNEENKNNFTSSYENWENLKIVEDCFRANLVINGNIQEYEEDKWKMVKIRGQTFKIISPCKRCQMVCINTETCKKTKEPYSTLAKYRRVKGKIYFGQHMIHLPELSSLPYEISSNYKVELLD